MSVINVHEAKTHLSRILERVAAGEQIVIARNGHSVAKLVPVGKAPRRPGGLRDRIRIAADFDDPLPESIAGTFRGETP